LSARLIAALLALALAPGFARGAGGAGTTGAASLKVAAGARPAALGGAFVGLADDANALFWNPAGLAAVDAREVGLMYTSYLVDTSYQLVSWAQPMPVLRGGVAAAVYTLDYGKLTLRDERADGLYGPATGSTAPREWYLTAGWGRPLPEIAGLGRLKVGASVKLTFQPATLGEVVGAGATAGALLDTPAEGLRVGLVADNLGALTSGGPALPINFRFGASYARPMGKSLSAVAAADARYFLDTGFRACGGVEVVAFDLLAVRGGWQSSGTDAAVTGPSGAAVPGEGGPTLGFGVRSPASWAGRSVRFSLDYALSTVGDLGQAHRVQLTVRL